MVVLNSILGLCNPLGLATETEKTRMNFVLQQFWPESEEKITEKNVAF